MGGGEWGAWKQLLMLFLGQEPSVPLAFRLPVIWGLAEPDSLKVLISSFRVHVEPGIN